MFGFAKKDPTAPELLSTRETEERLLELIKNSRKQLVLVSPWVTLGKLGTIRRAIMSALERGVSVRLYVRREDENLAEVIDDVKELVMNGLLLKLVHRLHAKIYWSENEAILTSLNLLESSFDKSVEFGLHFSKGDLHAEVLKFVDGFEIVGEGTKEKFEAGLGYCLRCGERISMNPARPYCDADYRSWSRYKNVNHPEPRCHRCGKQNESSMRKPLCRSCYSAVA